MLYYKLLRKRVVFTAHNINAGKRDENDTLLNRLTLMVQYRLADHIFVHTQKMKSELQRDFGVPAELITVVPFGINNSIPATALTTAEAKWRLGISNDEKTLLFFGGISPYKGLEYLVEAFLALAATSPEYRLIIAGLPKKGSEQYVNEIQRGISASAFRPRIIQRLQYIPDEDAEMYFKAADVLVLPYRHVFQSGVLFLGYSFGLPVVAADVGAIREDIVEGKTGFLCEPCRPRELMAAIVKYFNSDLFRNLEGRRQEICQHAKLRHSWEVVAMMTRKVYAELSTRPL